MGLHSSERWFIGFWAAVCLCSECDSLCCWVGEWRYGNKQVQMQGGYSYTVILQERNVWCERLCSVSLASYTETEMSVIIIKKKEMAVMMMNQSVRIMLLLPGSFLGWHLH